MRKLKTSLKPTVKTTNVLDVKMENLLSKNPVVTVLYTRNDNRYLVCKSASTFKLGFPVIKPIIVNFAVQTGKSTSKDIANQVIDTMRKEFGLDPEILNYYEGTKRPYVYQNEYLKGNDIAFDTRDAGQYVGKPEIVKNPSGEYTDERWLTLSEINDLMNQGLFDENSSYYATRCSEAKRKRAVLDPRLSLHVYADKDGVHFNNNSKDQMPLKTLNGNGLQKLEETEDYCIYICKDAIMTTVEKYAPGAYQKFQETQALINNNEGLLKEYSIDWVNKDDADLFIQINNDEVAKIESQPMMLPVEGEEQVQPIVLEPRTVPTTYDCCFTVRKDDNYSLYINEGYEVIVANLATNNPSQESSTHKRTLNSDGTVSLEWTNNSDFIGIVVNASIFNIKLNETITCYSDLEVYKGELKTDPLNIFDINSNIIAPFYDTTLVFNKTGIVSHTSNKSIIDGHRVSWNSMYRNVQVGSVKIKKAWITRTSTPKPFVKTIQPNCKMAFETPATSETHSFIMKGITQGTGAVTRAISFMNGKVMSRYGCAEVLKGEDYNSIIISRSSYNPTEEVVDTSMMYNKIGKYTKDNITFKNCSNTNSSKDKDKVVSEVLLTDVLYRPFSFTQLLIYKGNLTEAELKAELAKLDDQGFSYKKTENTWSISTRMWIDQYGLKKYDNPRDPFPFKTINNSGIKIMEETEDYQIWIDKDAVMTTVEKYVTGSYQTFLERKANIDGSTELLSLHEIEWTAQDDAKLFEDINNEALVKLEQSVMMLPLDGENEVKPIILEPKTVPTTYECCFRIDKKTGEFYIGEGYENLLNNKSYEENSTDFFIRYREVSAVSSDDLFLRTTTKISSRFKIYFKDSVSNIESFNTPTEQIINIKGGTDGTWAFSIEKTDPLIPLEEFQLTKTSTPKPFVKSVMPAGKLAFVTNATSETHSFVMKGMDYGGVNGTTISAIALGNDRGVSNLAKLLVLRDREQKNGVFSSLYTDLRVLNDAGQQIPNGVIKVGERALGWSIPYFTQLLIYKGNLTETELKAENEKYN